MRRLLEPTGRNLSLWGVALFLGSLAAFLWGITAWGEPYFDETWYVPTARTLLATGEMLHQEHPPLGKLLISLGMLVFGDNPLGWRAMSAVFGAVTLVGMFFWSYALLRHVGRALWVAGLTLVDQFLYVQSRIAMLDIFVMAFCTLSLAFFTLSIKEKSRRRAFAFAVAMGASLGLASACKWSGMFLLFGIVAVALLVGVLRLWHVRFADSRDTDFFGDDVWGFLTPATGVVVFLAAPAFAYAFTYLPQMIHEGSVLEFFASHRRMLEIMTGDPGTHPYASKWYLWPALIRPVWYLFQIGGGAPWSAQNPALAISGLANPVVVFAGEIAIAWATIAWLRARDIDAMIVLVAFFSQYLPWAIDPKGLEFSYYYFPPLLCAGPALALVLFRPNGRLGTWPAVALLAGAALVFCFFLPVLSASVGVTPHGLTIRTWLRSWS